MKSSRIFCHLQLPEPHVARLTAIAMLLASTPNVSAAPLLPGEGFTVERYAVTLQPDLKSKALSGTETLVLRSSVDGLNRVVFSPNALHLHEATLNGRPVDVSSSSDGIALAFDRALGRGKVATLSFKFEGTPARGVVTMASGLYTSYFACDWMVCLQDSPGNKALFSLDLLVPAGVTTLSIGRALPVQTLSDGTTRHRWRSARPYSAYLFGFAAGQFTAQSLHADSGEFTHLDGTGQGAKLAAAFSATPSIARFLAEKAGIGLPDHRYTQLLVPDSEAQEAARFSLIGAQDLADEKETPAAAWVIAHEMAHQWWGNSVTCASWQHFWLNEGITTFMVAAWKEQAFGATAYQQELEGAQRRLEKARAAGYDKPLAWSGTYPSLGIRRAIQYSKGALFLAHLRQTLGDEAFWKGIRHYTRKHAGKTVTSRDFQLSMGSASTRNLSELFSHWVYDDPAQ